MGAVIALVIAIGFAVPIAVIGGGLGQGKAAAAALEAIARQPEAASKIQTAMIIGLALIESLVIYAFVIALICCSWACRAQRTCSISFQVSETAEVGVLTSGTDSELANPADTDGRLPAGGAGILALLVGPIQGIIDARREEVEGEYSAAEKDRRRPRT